MNTQQTPPKVSLLNSCVVCFVAALSLLWSTTGWTKVEYDSDQLLMKNSEQVSEIVRKKIKKAQDIQTKQEDDDDRGTAAEPEAIDQLKDGTRIILSRRDQDGTRATVFTRLRNELNDLNSLDQVLSDLTHEAIDALKNSSTPVKRQTTYVVLLENLMAELKPEVQSNKNFKKLFEEIRDADIQLSDKVKSEQRLRSMTKVVSPSETAAKIVPKPKK